MSNFQGLARKQKGGFMEMDQGINGYYFDPEYFRF